MAQLTQPNINEINYIDWRTCDTTSSRPFKQEIGVNDEYGCKKNISWYSTEAGDYDLDTVDSDGVTAETSDIENDSPIAQQKIDNLTIEETQTIKVSTSSRFTQRLMELFKEDTDSHMNSGTAVGYVLKEYMNNGFHTRSTYANEDGSQTIVQVNLDMLVLTLPNPLKSNPTDADETFDLELHNNGALYTWFYGAFEPTFGLPTGEVAPSITVGTVTVTASDITHTGFELTDDGEVSTDPSAISATYFDPEGNIVARGDLINGTGTLAGTDPEVDLTTLNLKGYFGYYRGTSSISIASLEIKSSASTVTGIQAIDSEDSISVNYTYVAGSSPAGSPAIKIALSSDVTTTLNTQPMIEGPNQQVMFTSANVNFAEGDNEYTIRFVEGTVEIAKTTVNHTGSAPALTSTAKKKIKKENK